MLSLRRSLWLIIALTLALFVLASLPWSVYGVEGGRWTVEVAAAEQTGFQMFTGGFDNVDAPNLTIYRSANVEMNRQRALGLPAIPTIGVALFASLCAALCAAAVLARRPLARRALFPCAAVAALSLLLTFASDLPLETLSARLDVRTSSLFKGLFDASAAPSFEVFLTYPFWFALAVVGFQAWVAFQVSRVMASDAD